MILANLAFEGWRGGDFAGIFEKTGVHDVPQECRTLPRPHSPLRPMYFRIASLRVRT